MRPGDAVPDIFCEGMLPCDDPEKKFPLEKCKYTRQTQYVNKFAEK